MVDPPRWIADEMVGRLARYLRFVGQDTFYARGLADADIVEVARTEGRILLTRDRQLASRAPGSLLLTSPRIADQFLAVVSAFPAISFDVRFDRCSVCNGRLVPAPDTFVLGTPIARSVAQRGQPVHVCEGCGHSYWEGSHTAQIRKQIATWRQGRP
jgi:uncharacterized protein with PIN domain